MTKKFFNPKWNGSQNAFHQTISSLVQGNFGKSLVDDAPVLQKIKSAIVWTLSIQIPHYLLLFFIAIYFGKYTTLYNHGVIKLTKEILLALHSIPLFWLASILLLLFSTQLLFAQFLYEYCRSKSISSMDTISTIFYIATIEHDFTID